MAFMKLYIGFMLKISELMDLIVKEFLEIIGVFDFLSLFCGNILQ